MVLIWVVILELVLVIWQFIRKKEAINCTKVQRFTANTTATATTATAATTAATATNYCYCCYYYCYCCYCLPLKKKA